MSVQKLASRYAKSLMDLSLERSSTDKVFEDMKLFNKTVASSQDLYLAMKSPIINSDKKRSILKEIFGKSFDELSLGFFDIVLNKKREAYLHDIAKQFITQYKTFKRVVTVKVITAVPLTDESLLNTLTAKVKANVDCETVEIVRVVDPSIMGGFILEFEGQLFDSSIATKLEKLRMKIIDTQYIKKY